MAATDYDLTTPPWVPLIIMGTNAVTYWVNNGLREEDSNPDFKRRLDHLDAAISRRS